MHSPAKYQIISGIPWRYLLRWRFVYSDGKPDKAGLWCDSGGIETMAAYTTKEGLGHAIIEGKDLVTRNTKKLVSIPGHAFRNFEFLGAVKAPMGNLKKPVTIAPMILGARLISGENRYTVFISGRQTSESLSDAEKSYYEGLRR
jgi:hypothetical protein